MKILVSELSDGLFLTISKLGCVLTSNFISLFLAKTNLLGLMCTTILINLAKTHLD